MTAEQPPRSTLPAQLAHELTAFVTPLINAGRDDDACGAYLARLGWIAAAVPGLSTAVLAASQALAAGTEALLTLVDSDEEGANPPDLAQVLPTVRAMLAAIADLGAIPTRTTEASELADLGRDVLALLGEDYLRRRQPVIGGLLELSGAFTPQARAETRPAVEMDGHLIRHEYRLPQFRPQAIADLLTAPADRLRGLYGNAAADLPGLLFPVLADVLVAVGFGARYGLDPYFTLDLQPAQRDLLEQSLTIWLLESDEAEDIRLALAAAVIPPSDDTDNRPGVVLVPLLAGEIATGIVGWDISVSITGLAPLTFIGWREVTSPAASVQLTVSSPTVSPASLATADTGNASAGPPAVSLGTSLSVTEVWDVGLCFETRGPRDGNNLLQSR